MPIERIDRDMVRAAIAAEDSKFCAHWGFDQRRDRGGDAAQRARRPVIRGGSTISQQTAKNVFLWQGGGYFRKGLEAWFTLLIEKLWGKRRIMEVYLNVAETGIGTYGVNAGARRYFGHDASRAEPARGGADRRRPAAPQAPRGDRPGRLHPPLRQHRSRRRMAQVGRDGLDGCVYEQTASSRRRPGPMNSRDRGSRRRFRPLDHRPRSSVPAFAGVTVPCRVRTAS